MDRFTFRAYEYVEFLCMQQTVGYPKIRRFTTKTGFILKDPPRSTWEFPKKRRRGSSTFSPWSIKCQQTRSMSSHFVAWPRLGSFNVGSPKSPSVSAKGRCKKSALFLSHVQTVILVQGPCNERSSKKHASPTVDSTSWFVRVILWKRHHSFNTKMVKFWGKMQTTFRQMASWQDQKSAPRLLQQDVIKAPVAVWWLQPVVANHIHLCLYIYTHHYS